jgi:hypothetical protein
MKQFLIFLAALATLSAVALIAPNNASAQCCDKLCRADGSSIRCGHAIHGTPLGCMNCTPAFSGPTDSLDWGCVAVEPAPENDPSKSGICEGGTLLSSSGALLLGCLCVGEFGCFDGQTAAPISNTQCRAAAIAHCNANVVIEPADPDCVH